MKPDLAIVIPVYNEEEVLPQLFKALEQMSKALKNNKVTHHIIFVDDGSTDKSQILLQRFADRSNIPTTIIKLTRNFGHQAAIQAGYKHAEAKYIASIDADLQDDPLLIPKMYARLIKSGKDIILAQRKRRQEHSFLKLITARIYYKIYNLLADYPIPEEVADFRIISNRVRKDLLKIKAYPRFFRGAIAYLGYPYTLFQYERNPRSAGKTKYSLKKMLQLAVTGLLNYSTKTTWLMPLWFLLGSILTYSTSIILHHLDTSLYITYLIPWIGVIITTFPIVYLHFKFLVHLNQIATHKPVFVVDYIYNNRYAQRLNQRKTSKRTK